MHLERITGILEIVGQRGEATVADICAHSDLPKPSAYRLVQDLVGVGLLEPVARGRFAIGTRLKGITQSDHSDRALLELIAPVLKQAASEIGAAFFLSRLRGKSVEIIHVETPDTGVSYLHPGLGKRPLHACSCSKAVAAFSPGLFLTGEMEGRLRAYTEFTLTNVHDLEAEFEIIRQRGFAECVEEIERGMCSVAAPLAPSGPGATLSIGATGSVRVFTSAFRERLGPQITQIAREISTSLSWDIEQDTRIKSLS
ncbi:MAG: IclR family transcriptional regulator C-terminal domain-containing protein [Sediminimonas sp.]|uniref:IclR family transcriptional regulator n=1 Tax=Sediminimonas sp. TaxID=2823379 RepID=UPI0028704A9F|nr:IclR family transcriptional regulator C-terminal domain-containing protein [Sediminimonas sp.]MDR9485935.1 IclR family transcriptional regulator C-terminal domain-containing protein [Sediminimonas sp.]